MKDNPIDIFVEDNNEYWWGLKTTLLNGSDKKVYTQNSLFNCDFIKLAVNEALRMFKH